MAVRWEGENDSAMRGEWQYNEREEWLCDGDIMSCAKECQLLRSRKYGIAMKEEQAYHFHHRNLLQIRASLLKSE